MFRKLVLFLFSHRFLAIARWDVHFLSARFCNAVTFQPLRIQRFLATRHAPLFLNVGSGPRGLDSSHWLNVDGFWDKNVHFVLDLSRPLPLPENLFAGAFSEHVLEHFTQDDGGRLAREIHRVLVPDGTFRVIVPDAEALLHRYVNSNEELVNYRGGTPMEVVNSFFHQRYEHQFLYDFETLAAVLKRAGFKSVTKVTCRHGSVSELAELDDPVYEWESLYVEAKK